VGSLEPTTEAGRRGLAALLAEPRRALIALDFDGTLAPIVPDPDAARAHPGVRPAFDRLSGSVGRIAVITGRPARVAVDYGGLAGVPGLVVLGHYGLERWSDGEVQAPAEDEGVAVVRERLPELLLRLGAAEGTAIEDKGRSLAVHVRRAADPAAAMAVVEPALRALAADTGLVVEPGRMVLELRPPGADKGAALRRLVDELEPSAVVFVGDDLGDLAAFAAVDELRADGVPGLLVCSGSTEVTELADRADLVVDGPAGVVDVLESLADELVSPAPPPGS
jgi:trehalose 6-phosphate phosphatase